MRIEPMRVLAEAWALWRRDRSLLLRLAAPFLFLPDYALRLLLPRPVAAADAQLSILDAAQQQGAFIGAHLPAFLLATGLVHLGLASLLALYLDPARPDVRGALRRGALAWPRYILASLLVSLPVMLGLLLILPGLLIAGRTMATGPALLAEQPLSAAGAIARSLRITRGATLPLTLLAAITLGARMIAPLPLESMDEWLRSLGAPNPVALAVIDGAAAGVNMLAEIAAVLVAIAAYRALTGASRGM